MQVGRGLAFLHASCIVHGNLSSSTVLLRKSSLDRRGFIAKIGAGLDIHCICNMSETFARMFNVEHWRRHANFPSGITCNREDKLPVL